MKTRWQNIDFFRIIFTLMIIYGHIVEFWIRPIADKLPILQKLVDHIGTFGYLCEAFFIISGFFLLKSLEKKSDFGSFVKQKIIRLWPVLFFSLVAAYVVSLFDIVHFYKYENILTVTFTNNVFASFNTNNGCSWFVSVMFWGFIIFYSLYQIVDTKKVPFVVGLLTFSCYSILINKLNVYAEPYSLGGMFSYFFIRALAGLGLGLLLAYTYRVSLNKKHSDKSSRFCIGYGILETFILVLLIKFSVLKNIHTAYPIMVLLFASLFWLFLQKKGFLSQLLDCKLCSFLGRYCYSIYMIQELSFPVLNKFLWQNTQYGILVYPIANIVLGIFIICLEGVLIYYFVEQKGKQILTKVLLKDN